MSGLRSLLSGSCPIPLFVLVSFLTSLLILAHLPTDARAAETGGTDLTRCSEMSFTFSYPASWIVSTDPASCSAAGNLSLDGTCSHISLHWFRDPGTGPEGILDGIVEDYNRGGVSVSSSDRRTITMPGQTARILMLRYEFRNCQQTKIFAVWNSSASDRMFLCAFSGCSDSALSRSNDRDAEALPLERLISSFEDLGRNERIALEPGNLTGAWPVILGDLLSSYHYLSSDALPAGMFQVRVSHEISWVNGTYSLNSRESVRSDPPEIAIARAGAVLHILQEAGYEARAVQRRGEVGVAVQCPSGRWALVCIDPKDPRRMVGELTNETGEALIYESPGDLARENGVKCMAGSTTGNGNDAGLNGMVAKDCEPSLYVELQPPGQANYSWLKSLEDELRSNEYRRNYERDIFDCSSTAQICWTALSEKGFNPKLMLSCKGQTLGEHMWIVVETPYEKGRYVAVETANVDQNRRLVNLGRIVADGAYLRGIMYNSSKQFSRMHPEEGI